MPPIPLRTEEFSWLQKSEPETRAAGDDLTWREQAGNGRSAETADGSSQLVGAGRAHVAADPAVDPDITERILRHQAEGLAAQERTDFWGQPLPLAPADLRIPAAAPQAEEPAITRASWPSAADTAPCGRGTRAPERGRRHGQAAQHGRVTGAGGG